jgi:hypothetical protein
LNINIKNLDEAKDYIENEKGYIIAELLFYQLMKEQGQTREQLYKMLIDYDNIENK